MSRKVFAMVDRLVQSHIDCEQLLLCWKSRGVVNGLLHRVRRYEQAARARKKPWGGKQVR